MIFALFACAVTADNYNDRVATSICDRSEECDASAFESAFGDQAGCKDELTSLFNENSDCVDYCTFDADAAQTCLDDIKAIACDEFKTGAYGDACPKVWDCDNEEYIQCMGPADTAAPPA